MKEDPKVKKKRDDILAKIHAAELASERARKERLMRRKAEEEASKKKAASNDGGGGDMLAPSDQSLSGNADECYQNDEFSKRDDSTNNSSNTIRRATKLRRRYSMENPLTHLKGVRRNSGALDDESDEKEGYGDSFSFLSEWCAAEKSKKKKKKNLTALTKQENSG